MKKPLLAIPSLAVVAVIGIALYSHQAGAVNDTLISKAIQLNRLRVNYGDVTSTPNVADPDGVCNGMAKRVVVMSLAAASEVNAIVTKTRNAFSSPSSTLSQIGIIAVRAEQNGVQVSTGDIATPDTDLTDTSYIENRKPSIGEYLFYDENDPWDIVAYVCGKDVNNNPIDISNLNHGNVDFYVTVTK
ncbi:MAG TPA: hypothetical protein VMU11_00300 [Verrucomicrobiae bacterium]|nr:hypothetical protein [Verrucomicrobiae bacterium]